MMTHDVALTESHFASSESDIALTESVALTESMVHGTRIPKPRDATAKLGFDGLPISVVHSERHIICPAGGILVGREAQQILLDAVTERK
jgi:hypothetical protein